ncbi:metal ABC transporter ATP-binding protein [Carboxydochorda subterranea]|uniref:Metal ABC transporter ATP-binding protein n=1 Tax=Carboxydichorda subterranea TaxID=3109565 RepID=A0ABZ1BXG9_9FIRM|nr:metal ABC transporter ATP-binding protein [Limnochorda sp. L945t]WRP17499.1 metal ABC transporter ATP-binding protein [Limnochorda sp. L945t]
MVAERQVAVLPDGEVAGPAPAPGGSARPLLEVAGLRAGYGTRVVLHDVSFTVEAGQRVAVVGPNGAGKSTLFKCVAGVLRPLAGAVRVQGGPVAYAPQREAVNWHFPATVWDVVMMARYPYYGLWRRPRPEDREAVAEALEQVGMAGLARSPIQDLSGGQQQRVFLARALAQRARLVVLDEPFNAVEEGAQAAVIEALSRLRERGVALLVSTHDLDFVAGSDWFDRVMVLNGRILAFGPPQQVCGRPSATGSPSMVRWAQPARWAAWASSAPSESRDGGTA